MYACIYIERGGGVWVCLCMCVGGCINYRSVVYVRECVCICVCGVGGGGGVHSLSKKGRVRRDSVHCTGICIIYLHVVMRETVVTGGRRVHMVVCGFVYWCWNNRLTNHPDSG